MGAYSAEFFAAGSVVHKESVGVPQHGVNDALLCGIGSGFDEHGENFAQVGPASQQKIDRFAYSSVDEMNILAGHRREQFGKGICGVGETPVRTIPLEMRDVLVNNQ